jgi:glycosyltransferase involved in cell wall biosynthesis
VANLYIIDQSLKGTGGHHLDYARCVALAAQQQGLKTTIGTNRKFDAQHWFDHPTAASNDDATRIIPAFKNTVYQTDSYLAGLQQMTRSRSPQTLPPTPNQNLFSRCFAAAGGLIHRRRRHWIARQFADDCARMFKDIVFETGDQVFLTTVSELELTGLPKFLASNPASRRATWHLQFHFNLFDGRTDEYAEQKDTAALVADNIESVLKNLSGHSIHFHTTSQTLANQYNLLGVAQFHSLPYPIADEFRCGRALPPKSIDRPLQLSKLETPSDRALAKTESKNTDTKANTPRSSDVLPLSTSSSPRTLRVVCPGGIRREKGQQEYLQSLVGSIWESHLASEQVQLIVQRPKPKWPSKQEKISLQVPQHSNEKPPIQYAEHPLPAAEYVKLIRSADIGLLFYDGRKYFSRRAGILGELLACGKPVIVSAGSWLSDQIEEANFAYADRTAKRLAPVRKLSIENLQWSHRNVPLPGGVVSFDQGKHSFEFEVSPANTEKVMSLAFAWHWPQESGVYCRIEVQQYSQNGQRIQSSLRVAGVRRRNQRSNVLFNVAPQATRVRFTLKNAFGKSTATIHQLSVATYSKTSTGPIPTGTVGLAATDQGDLVNCIAEMVKHYDHYKKSAADFSTGWNANHDPALTVDYLVDHDQSFQRVA